MDKFHSLVTENACLIILKKQEGEGHMEEISDTHRTVKIEKPIKIEHPEVGQTQYGIVNTPEYCGKIIVQRDGTTTPAHFHKKKHETFLVWSGKFRVVVDDQTVEMKPGDVLVMERGRIHQFTAVGGDAIMFEFSTHSSISDSYFVKREMAKKLFQHSIKTRHYQWPF